MRLLPLAFLLLLSPGLLRAGEETASIRLSRAREILERARPHLVALTGLEWPPNLEVEQIDEAGLVELLLAEYRARSASSTAARSALVRALARSLRAKYGLATRRIHVTEGALHRLPRAMDPDHAFAWILLHEAVHAMDDHRADLGRLVAAEGDHDARIALHMVLEGRAEHYGAAAAARLGIPAATGLHFDSLRTGAERLLRTAGRRFIAALEEQDPELPLRALLDPPRSTSVVFHPHRYLSPPEHPDPVAALRPLAGDGPVSAISEFALRTRLLEDLPAERVEAIFDGYLAGASTLVRRSRTVTLVVLRDEAAARRFSRATLEVHGHSPGERPDIFSWERTVGGSRRVRFTVGVAGRWVCEAFDTTGADPEPTVRSVFRGLPGR